MTSYNKINFLIGHNFSLYCRKRWEIFKVELDKVTEEEILTTLETPIKELAPDTFEEAELKILPRMLMYGVYKLIFYSRMWDTDDADPIMTRTLPFIKVIIRY